MSIAVSHQRASAPATSCWRRPSRRELLATAMMLAGAPRISRAMTIEESTPMYGLIGKMITAPGQRDALIAILLEGAGGMPGCLSYVVAKDAGDENGIWITEVWDTQASHDASLSLPAVQGAIARGRPLIAGFEQSITTVPMGGIGLPPDQGR